MCTEIIIPCTAAIRYGSDGNMVDISYSIIGNHSKCDYHIVCNNLLEQQRNNMVILIYPCRPLKLNF